VLAAVESLYDDQLKPVSRILRKRLLERSVEESLGCALSPALGEHQQEIDVERLQALCHQSQDIVIQREVGGDWAALLVGRPCNFIDVYSNEDQYPEELWSVISAYCKKEFFSSTGLPGGRYACALALKEAKLPLLSSRSLGQICHVVQLALSTRKLLGYSSGAIVPYSNSQSMVKERCAKNRAPCSQAPMIVATWEVARAYLWQLLQSEESGQLPLPNVKRLFRSRFHVELSETKFGYSKISDLLQDERFQDICEVQQRGQGYVVVPKMPQGIPNVISLYQSLSQHQELADAVEDVAPRRVELCEPLKTDEVSFLDERVPVSLVHTPTPGLLAKCGHAATRFASSTSWELSQDGYKGMVKNSFIQINRHPLTPGLPASHSMPALTSMDTLQSRSGESTTDSHDSDRESDASYTDERRSGQADSLADLLKEAGACSPLHGVISAPCQSILRTPGKTKTFRRVNFCLAEPRHDTETLSDPAPQTPKVLFPDTPVIPFPLSPAAFAYDKGFDPSRGLLYARSDFDELEELDCAHEAISLESPLPNLLCTPGSLSKQGFVSRNTFLHVQKNPPTPYVKKESRRSKSLGAAMPW
jgi:hypothetical protein